MPYKNIEKKKKYHREYMSKYLKTHKLTEEQKQKKALYMREWNKKNKAKVKALSHKSYLKNKEKRLSSAKKYREKNKDAYKIRYKKYYLSRKNYFSEQAKKYYLLNKEKIRSYKREYAHTLKSRFNSYIHSAKKRSIEFLLSRDDFETLMKSKCHYCGQENSWGIDRKDSNSIYIASNCLPCCKICNYMKRDMDYNDFISKIKQIYITLKD